MEFFLFICKDVTTISMQCWAEEKMDSYFSEVGSMKVFCGQQQTSKTMLFGPNPEINNNYWAKATSLGPKYSDVDEQVAALAEVS